MIYSSPRSAPKHAKWHGTGPTWHWPGMALAQVRERKGKKEPLLDQAFRGKQDFTGMKY